MMDFDAESNKAGAPEMASGQPTRRGTAYCVGRARWEP